MAKKHNQAAAAASTVASTPTPWEQLTTQQKAHDLFGAATGLSLAVLACYVGYRVIRWDVKRYKAKQPNPENRTAEQFYSDNPPFLTINEAERFKDYRGDIAKYDRDPTTYGNARYAGCGEIAAAGLFADTGIPLGYGIDLGADPQFRVTGWLRYNEGEHLITFGPAGSGKFTTTLAPLILSPLEVGNFLFVDSKGEASAVSKTVSNAPGRRAFYVMPFPLWPGLIPDATAYNPLDALNPDALDFVADCDSIFSNLVEETGDDKTDFFNGTACKLLGGLTYFYKKYAPAEDQNLVSVYRTVARPDLLEDTVNLALAIPDELLQERLSRYKGLKDTQRSAEDILRTAEKILSFVSDPAIAKSLSGGSGFTFRELRKPNTRVFLVLPGKHLTTHAKWFRLLVSCAIRELMDDIKGERVTMVIDEAAQLGYMQQLVTGMPQTRGYRLRFWPIFQDIAQINRIYGKAAKTLMSACGIQQFFTPTDVETAQSISDRCGRYTVTVVNESSSNSKSSGSGTSPGGSSSNSGQSYSSSTSTSQTGRPLCDVMEVMNSPATFQWLFSNKMGHAIGAGRAPYYEMPVLRDRADPNPYHIQEAA